MTINYDVLQAKAASVISSFGLPVTITRAGTKVISTYGVFVGQKQNDDTKSRSSLLAQSEVGTRTMLISGSGKPLMIGDLLTADKTTFTITQIEVTRPSVTTVLYKVQLT